VVVVTSHLSKKDLPKLNSKDLSEEVGSSLMETQEFYGILRSLKPDWFGKFRCNLHKGNAPGIPVFWSWYSDTINMFASTNLDIYSNIHI